MLARRLGRNRFAAAPHTTTMDSSDEEIDDTQATTVHNFHDLESFQKAQLLNKVSNLYFIFILILYLTTMWLYS